MVTKKTKKKAIPPIQLREDEIPFWNRTISKVKDPEESQDVATKNYVDTQGGSGASYTAGDNITIENNVISATDTTYSDFTGTDGTSAGTAGLVPAPATTDVDKFLKSDGTWDTAGGGGGIPTDATLWGQSYDATNNNVNGNIRFPTDTGTNSIIKSNNRYSSSVQISGNSIGFQPGGWSLSVFDITSHKITTKKNIELTDSGDSLFSTNGGTISAYVRFDKTNNNLWLGANNAIYVARASGTGNDPQIKGVADPTDNQDVANKRYVDSIYPVGTVIMSTSNSVPNIAGGTWSLIGNQSIGSTPRTVNYFERTA